MSFHQNSLNILHLLLFFTCFGLPIVIARMYLIAKIHYLSILFFFFFAADDDALSLLRVAVGNPERQIDS
ncbi:hypothetical protein H5410_011551 [Solanum commersonii]|uniref:Uncharacterized protein n=1 Tax=Solanum commersonii TaxID=4109 RepID=A0A9J6ANY6_SOLCO|nr:hypothetical protein H5410_011551 [Solanum commersonii]